MNASPSSSSTDRDALKRAAAEAAVQLVENDMVVGLGSGSTAAFAVEALARRHRQGLRFVGIPTSERTAAQAKAADIPLTSFSEHRQIDLTIDGADEVERGTLNLIKGLGGALLREKIVAAASHRLAIVVDGSKLVDRLGTRTPVPVEVVAFGLEATRESLEVLGAGAQTRMSLGAPFVTDSGNRILDCDFGRIADPARLDERIRRIVGVVESGLFISRADPVFVADASRCPSPRQRLALIGAVRRSWWSWACRGPENRRSPKNSRRGSAGRSRRAIHSIRNQISPRCTPEFRSRMPTVCRGWSAWPLGSMGSAPRSSPASSRAPHSNEAIAKSSSAIGQRCGWSICAAVET